MSEENVPSGIDPEAHARFIAWKNTPAPLNEREAKPVKLIDLIGSFSWIYETIRDGDQTADEVEAECEEIFEAFIKELLTPNWKHLHDTIADIHEGISDLSAEERG